MAIATEAPAFKVRALTRPRAVFTRMRPLLRSNQTGVTCGEPSGITVARIANAFFCCNRSRYLSGMVAAMTQTPWRSIAACGRKRILKLAAYASPGGSGSKSKMGSIRLAKAVTNAHPRPELSKLGLQKSARVYGAAHGLVR